MMKYITNKKGANHLSITKTKSRLELTKLCNFSTNSSLIFFMEKMEFGMERVPFFVKDQGSSEILYKTVKTIKKEPRQTFVNL